MNRFKPSFYNYFFDAGVGDGSLAYNSRSNILLHFSADDYREVEHIINSLQKHTAYNPKSNVVDLLVDNHFLVPKEEDELEAIKLSSKTGIEKKKSLTLTLAPTLACNLRCTYCFENHTSEKMSVEVQTKLLDFVQSKVRKGGNLHINWFGGEPLLEPRIIQELSQKFIIICKEKKVNYSASIITNGVLLTKKNAEMLRDCQVKNTQITLDGMPEIHNKRRPDLSGKGTFEKIIGNIKAANEYLTIIVRVNIDKTNREQIQWLTDYFQKDKTLSGIYIYPGQVQGFSEVCNDIASNCIENLDFTQITFQRYIKEYQKGFARAEFPKRLEHACCADHANSFVIAPSGLVFKCWNEIAETEKKSIGSLLQKTVYSKKRDPYSWDNWNIFQYEDCINCKFLPICMGSCPNMAIKNQDATSAICTPFKETLLDTLRLYHVDQLIRQS